MKAKRLRDEEDEAVEHALSAFPLGDVPPDVLIMIMANMSVPQMIRLCRVSKRFNAACKNGLLWDHIFIERVLAKKKVEWSIKARAPYMAMELFKMWEASKAIMPDNMARLLAFLYVSAGSTTFQKRRNDAIIDVTVFPSTMYPGGFVIFPVVQNDEGELWQVEDDDVHAVGLNPVLDQLNPKETEVGIVITPVSLYQYSYLMMLNGWEPTGINNRHLLLAAEIQQQGKLETKLLGYKTPLPFPVVVVVEGKMKRSRSDAELNAIVEKTWADFPLDRLPSDLVYTLVFRSGLSVLDMHRLCSINQRFRRICEERDIWDKAFIEHFLAMGKPVSDDEFKKYRETYDYEEWAEEAKEMPVGFAHLLARSLKELVEPELVRGDLEAHIEFNEDERMHEFFVMDWGHPDAFSGEAVVKHSSNYPSDLKKTMVAVGATGLGSSKYVPRQKYVLLLYRLLEDGWRPAKGQHLINLECELCGSENATVICGKCKSLAFCSSTCMDTFFSEEANATEHDAVCFKADCKDPAYLAKHLSRLMVDTEDEEAAKRLHDSLLFDAEPTAALINEAHELVRKLSGLKAKRRARSAKRSGSKSRRAARRENKRRSASKRRAMKKAAQKSRSKSRSRSKGKPAQRARSRSKGKKPATRSKSRSKSKGKPAQRARSKSKGKKPATRSKEGRSRSRERGRPLFSSRSRRTDNRSYRGPTFNFGGRGNSTTTTTTPTIPSIPSPSPAPAVIVVPQSQTTTTTPPRPPPPQTDSFSGDERSDSEAETTKVQ